MPYASQITDFATASVAAIQAAAVAGAGLDLSGGTLTNFAMKAYNEVLASGAAAANTGSAFALNANLGRTFFLLLNANCTFSFTNLPAAGKAGFITMVLKNDATPNRTLVFPASVKWSGGTVPLRSTAANAVDIWTFLTVDGGVTVLSNLALFDVK